MAVAEYVTIACPRDTPSRTIENESPSNRDRRFDRLAIVVARAKP